MPAAKLKKMDNLDLPKIKRKGQLRLRILTILLCLTIIPLILIGLIVLGQVQSIQIKANGQIQKNIAEHAAFMVSSFANDQFLTLENSQMLTQTPETGIGEILKSHSTFLEIAVASSSGQLLVGKSKIASLSANLQQIPSEEYSMLLKNKKVISLVVTPQDISKPVLLMRTFMRNKHPNEGVIISAIVDTSSLYDIMKEFTVGKNGQIFLVNKQGTVISHKDTNITNSHPNFKQFCPVKNFIDNTDEMCQYQNWQKDLVFGYYKPVMMIGDLAIVIESPVAEALATAYLLRNFVIIAIILIIVVVVIFSSLISFGITRPLEKLYLGAQALGQGNFGFRLKIKSGDEIEDLANEFNNLAEKLQKNIAQLMGDREVISAERNKLAVILSGVKDAVIAVDLKRNIVTFNKASENLLKLKSSQVLGKPISDIIKIFDQDTEILQDFYCPIRTDGFEGSVFTKSNLKLISASNNHSFVNLISSQISEGAAVNLGGILTIHDRSNEKQLEEMKLDFVSMAAHELRTPLTSIRDYLGVFIKENHDKFNHEQNDFLNRINVSVYQLMSLVEDLLNISRIERGNMSISLQKVDLVNLAKQSVENFTVQSKEKGIELKFIEPQQSLPQVMADPMRITEVLSNLIINAITYTQERGKVYVFVRPYNGGAIVDIADNGPGIPQEAMPYLFTKFFRISRTLKGGTKGSGLGLYISKAIINMHYGKIWTQSEIGKGSTFSFFLPV